jgi:hypothetical protein
MREIQHRLGESQDVFIREEGVLKKTTALVALLIVGIFLGGVQDLEAQKKSFKERMAEIDIPNKLGFGLTLYNQTQPYQIKSLELGIPNIPEEPLSDLPVANNTTSTHLRIDYWVLPFLNVFGLVGKIDSNTSVDLGGFDLGLPIELDDLQVDSKGTVYGLGLVLAVGGEHWFAAVAYDITSTDIDVRTSSVEAQILSPKVGLHFDGGAIWLGARYQGVEETHEGIYQLPVIGDVPYKVVLEARDPWSWVIGGTAGLTKHLVLRLEGGFGHRKAALVTLEYRIF